MTLNARIFAAVCCCIATIASFTANVNAQSFTVGNYEVLSSTRVGRTTFDFVIRATITNRVLAAQGVSAKATSSSTNTVVIQDTLQFGDVPLGAAVVSTNTFVVRHDRSFPFSTAVLQWAVSVQSMPLMITLESPVAGFLTNGTNLIVSGTIGPAVGSVEVNGFTATIDGSNYTANVPLREGRNTLSAVARNSFGGSGSASVVVSRDTTPPIVTIESPSNGLVTASPQLTVVGMINDVVSGTVNAEQASVMVNGIAASVVNRSYVAAEVLLARGSNRVTAVARDRAGNEARTTIEVVYQDAADQKRLVLVSGDHQSGLIGSTLPEPLLVALLDANGAALTNQPVTFTVARNDGVVRAAPNEGRELTILTDDKGLASVLFRLGSRTGAGNNQVTVTSPGVVGQLMFCASAQVGAAHRISALLPETQVGAPGDPLPFPWTALVVDVGGNPVANVPVTFMVFSGDGNIGGATMVTTNSNSDGRVSVRHTLGPIEGRNNNMVLAMVAGMTNATAIFTATALTPRNPNDTWLNGVVLDHADLPMSNVLAHIEGTTLTAFTDGQGQFSISNAPVGAIRLLIDGTTTPYPGEWPILEFDLVTVAGQTNAVDRPIYLLPLDAQNSAIAGGPQDVTLKMKNLPGTELTVFANSVHAHGGARTARVMWTQVNLERVPMPPPLGSQFMLAWTVQPAGVHFDPPARICIPNMGSPPGQQVEIFSFDHDLGEFVAVGTATVTPDGSQMCSDPGFGVTKAGWGGCVPPPPPCTTICGPAPMNTECTTYTVTPPAQMCGCPTYTPMPVNNGGMCDDKDPCTVNDRCQNGTCKGDKIEITKVEAKANGTNDLVVATNQVVNFTVMVTQTNCPGLTYEWNFGDGMTSTAENPTHTYTTVGSFDVKVTVRCTVCPSAVKDHTIKVKTFGLNLIVHKPKVIDPGETAIPAADKLTKGSQTFVNLDNDDQDANFDTSTTDTDVGTENELIKLKLQITNKDVMQGKVKLSATAGAGDVKVWKKSNKMTEYMLASDLMVPGDFMVQGSVLEAELFVEGVAAHTAQRATTLRMTFDQAPALSDDVAITIIGIDSIVWEGQGNSRNDNNVLDVDSNFPGGLGPAGLRVFPDARGPGFFFDPLDKVTVKVNLSVAPLEAVNVFFRSFDTDDPTDAAAPVDDDTGTGAAEDNRGTTPARAGMLTGADGMGIVTISFDAKEKTFEFQTTMQPGDNFRIVGNGDKAFLGDLENDERNVGAADVDKQRITNRHVTGTASNKEVRDANKYASDVLTVWRFLHVELDSFGMVEDNFLEGNITGLDTGNSATATIVTVSTSPADGSPDLTSAMPDNGRFERGTLRVANTHNVTPLTGNGANDLRKTNGLNVCASALPFTAEDNDLIGGDTFSGTVTVISNGSLTLALNITAQSTTPIDWPDFIGGCISIGGGPDMDITAVDTNGVTVTVAALAIPYRVTDDDVISGDVPQPDTSGIAPIYAPAYVLPLFDTGENTTDVDFRLNSPDADQKSHINDEKGTGLAVNKYWVVTVLNAYQTGASRDNDPDGEGTDRGVSWLDAHGIIMCTESIRDWIATPSPLGGNGVDPAGVGRQARYQEILNHEIGHQFDQVHPDGAVTMADPMGGVEAPSCCPPDNPAMGTRGASTFTRIGLHRIRSVDHPGF